MLRFSSALPNWVWKNAATSAILQLAQARACCSVVRLQVRCAENLSPGKPWLQTLSFRARAESPRLILTHNNTPRPHTHRLFPSQALRAR